MDLQREEQKSNQDLDKVLGSTDVDFNDIELGELESNTDLNGAAGPAGKTKTAQATKAKRT